MNYRSRYILPALVLFSANITWARAKHYQGAELARAATAIALVRVSTAGFAAGSTATVTKTIKGTAPSTIQLPTDGNFECPYDFRPGLYLVFMAKKDGRFVNAGNCQSWKRIEHGRVHWSLGFLKRNDEVMLLTEALKEIKSLDDK